MSEFYHKTVNFVKKFSLFSKKLSCGRQTWVKNVGLFSGVFISVRHA